MSRDDNPTEPYPDLSVDHPTLVIPGEETAATAAPAVKRRARWPWAVGITLIVLVGLVIAAEFVARAMLPGIVRGLVIEQLELPADQQMDVEAHGVLLPQLIGGSLDELTISTESVTIGEVTGAAEVTALGVPLRGGDVGSASGSVRIDQEQLQALLSASDLPIETVTLEEPDITAEGSVTVLGFSLPLALTATPGAEGGELTLTPVRLLLGGIELDAEQVADRLGSVGETVTQTQHLCIADQLPAGLTLTDVRVEGSEAVIDLSVDGGIVTDEALQQNGTCD